MILREQNANNFFLHSKSLSNTLEPINIILSPEFYWVRIFELPLESKKEVYKVLPSLFEDFLDISNLKFYVKKLSKNKYLSFAYDENKIMDAISTANIDSKLVNRIYFTQIEFLEQFKSKNLHNIKINDISLSLSNDIIVKIPENIKVQIENELNLNDISLSKEFISLNSATKYIDKSNSNLFSIFLFLISFIFLVKLIFNYSLINEYEEKIAQVKEVDNGSLSGIQLKSIIKKYNRIYNNQIENRNMMFYFLNIREKLNIKILSLVLENKKLKVIIQNDKTDKNFEKKIKSYIEKKYKNTIVKNTDTNIILEVNR